VPADTNGTSTTLPERARVVIVGGGVIGANIAYHLTKLGWKDVLLLERRQLTSGTTWHAAGLITSAGMAHETLLWMARYTRDLYVGLEEETGQATGWRPIGHLHIARTPERLETLRREAAFVRGFGVDNREISPKEFQAMWPEARIDDEPVAEQTADVDELAVRVAQTVSGLQRSSGGTVLASTIKRALLRKDPTFGEAEYGFRAFGELIRYLAERGVIELAEGSAKGDPEVSLPVHGGETEAFELLGSVVAGLQAKGQVAHLSGLKNKVRKVQPGFSEKTFGYGGFLQFAKAAATQGVITLEWDEQDEDYVLGVPKG